MGLAVETSISLSPSIKITSINMIRGLKNEKSNIPTQNFLGFSLES
nr:MAG TPA: hypothetical protein [Caudoviricetes sp.]